MGKSRWATDKEVKERLVRVDYKKGIEKSGIPITYEKNDLLIDDRESHNLIIGSTGSGKTQSLILPMIKLSRLAGESLLVNDPKGELYIKTANKFKEDGYRVVLLDFDNSKYGNNWNPLELIYKNYKENNHDLVVDMLEDLGYYLFYEPNSNNTDPFWINTTIDYFTGLVLYLFKSGKEDVINLQSIYNLSNEVNNKDNSKKLLNSLNKNEEIYINLAGTLLAPPETRGSILSVFNQKMKKYISRRDLINMISNSDFKVEEIVDNKTVVFIKSGISSYSNNLVPLLVSQIMEYATQANNKKRINMLLDEFDSMVPIKDFAKVIMNGRSLSIRFTVTIQSYAHLEYMYGKNVNIIKYCFANIIYLITEDIPTLEEISDYCGSDNNNKKLITIEELKTIQPFEAIISMIRMMPIKTKLLPDYKIDWRYKEEEIEFPEREAKEVKLLKMEN